MRCKFIMPTYDEFHKLSKEEIRKIYYHGESRLISHLCSGCKPEELDGELITSTRDLDKKGNVCVKCYDKDYIEKNGESLLVPINLPKIVVHPAVKYSTIDKSQKSKNKEVYVYCHDENGYSHKYIEYVHFEFGEYPTEIVGFDFESSYHDGQYKSKKINTSKLLEAKYQKNLLKLTGKKYTLGDKEFEEYIDGGKKYIRYMDESKSKRHYWILVQPIKWIYNESMDLAITKLPLVGGIPFTEKADYYGNFDDTTLKKFLDEKFSIEILPLPYYQLEKSFQDIDISENLQKICYELVNQKFQEETIECTTEELFDKIKSKYSNLNEDECKTIMKVILNIQSMMLKNPSYVEDKIKEKREKREKEEAEELKIITDEIEKNYQASKERKQKEKEEIEKEEFLQFASGIIDNIPDGLSDIEIIENIYKQVPYITDRQLREILEIYNQMKNNTELESRKKIS